MKKRLSLFILSSVVIFLISTGCGVDTTKGHGAPLIEPTENPGHQNINIDSISPTSGKGGDEVTIKGKKFEPLPLTVTFGSEKAYILQSNVSEIKVMVPAGSSKGPVDVTIKNAFGETATLENGFTYITTTNCTIKPEIDSISPTSGLKGTHLLLTGRNFQNNTIVLIDGRSVKVLNRENGTKMTALVPDNDSECTSGRCSYSVAAVSSDGCSGKSPVDFEYITSNSSDKIFYLGYLTDASISGWNKEYKYVLRRIDTGEEKVLTAFDEMPQKAFISPDQKYIYYLLYRSGLYYTEPNQKDVVIRLDLKTGEKKFLTDGQKCVSGLAISLDGSTLAWHEWDKSDTGWCWGLYFKASYSIIYMSSDDLKKHKSGIKSENATVQALSPDGSLIYYADANSNYLPTQRWLRVGTLTGTKKGEIETGKDDHQFPLHIFFTAVNPIQNIIWYKEGKPEKIYQASAADLTGKIEVNDKDIVTAGDLIFTPDGSGVYYTQNGNIFEAPIDLSTKKQITNYTNSSVWSLWAIEEK